MAFEGLTEKLSAAFKKLRGKGRLSEADVKDAMREIRLALLEADVSYKVVKDFIKKTTERAVGACRLVFAQSFARRDIGEFFYREGVKKSYQCFARVLQNHVDAPIEELEEAAARFIEMLRGPLLMRILCTPETQVTPEEIEEAAVRCADIMTVWMNERWPETRAA